MHERRLRPIRRSGYRPELIWGQFEGAEVDQLCIDHVRCGESDRLYTFTEGHRAVQGMSVIVVQKFVFDLVFTHLEELFRSVLI